MDTLEIDAINHLSKRKAWAYDELPVDVDLDMLRCLDDLGLIEARACGIVPNYNARKDPKAPKTRLLHGEWYSPMRRPIIGGKWESIAANHERTEWVHPHEIRLNDAGHAELSRARRHVTPSSPETQPEQPIGPALTEHMQRVLRTLAGMTASRLVSLSDIAEAIDPPLSERTIGPIVKDLIKLDLAERPQKRNGGVRLTLTGRRHASREP